MIKLLLQLFKSPDTQNRTLKNFTRLLKVIFFIKNKQKVFVVLGDINVGCGRYTTD